MPWRLRETRGSKYVDALSCPCGGRLKVVEVVTEADRARQVGEAQLFASAPLSSTGELMTSPLSSFTWPAAFARKRGVNEMWFDRELVVADFTGTLGIGERATDKTTELGAFPRPSAPRRRPRHHLRWFSSEDAELPLLQAQAARVARAARRGARRGRKEGMVSRLFAATVPGGPAPGATRGFERE